MPRFHFNVRTGSNMVDDGEGSIHVDLAAATHEAILNARDSMSRAVMTGHDISHRTTTEICDRAGRILLPVPFTDAFVVD